MKALLLVGMIKAKLFPKILSWKSLYHTLKRDLIGVVTIEALVKGIEACVVRGGGRTRVNTS